MDFERQLSDYAQMLDARALRIQKLESQLHAIAYGRARRTTATVGGGDPNQRPTVGGVAMVRLFLEFEIFFFIQNITGAVDKPMSIEPGYNSIELKLSKVFYFKNFLHCRFYSFN
jgi:hypothetical protein